MSFLQLTIYTLKCVCYLTLAFYFIKVMAFLLRGHPAARSHRLREAMATAYTLVAVVLISLSTEAILPFIQNVLETVDLVHTPPTYMRISLALCAGLVCTAFICNFSRSLWTLKSLDHGIFEPVPEWADLSESRPRQLRLEFAVRTIAALLFIALEFDLKKIATASLTEDVIDLARGGTPQNYLSQAGGRGLLLYFFLVVWWLVGLAIAKKQMPKKLLWFYLAGLFNSFFVFLYSSRTTNTDHAMLLLLIVAVAAIGALYMILYVLSDIAKTVVHSLNRWRLNQNA